MSTLDALVAPLDWGRRRTLGWLAKSQTVARAIGTRDVRIPVLAAAHVVILGALTLWAPVALFVVGPLLFGVPHLASDIRYLLLRTRVARPVLVASAVATLAMLLLRLAPLLGHGVGHAARAEIVVGAAWIGFALIAGARRAGRSVAFSTLALGVLGALCTLALRHPSLTRALLAHGHNVVGIGVWAVWFRRGRRRAWLPLLVLVTIALGLVLSVSESSRFGLTLTAIGQGLAPGLAPDLATASAMLFVFLQAVHYAVWLVWIPQEQLPHQGTFTFRMTTRSLLGDFGAPLLALFALVWLALLGSALLDARATLRVYVALAAFHGWLELAMLTYLVTTRAAR